MTAKFIVAGYIYGTLTEVSKSTIGHLLFKA